MRLNNTWVVTTLFLGFLFYFATLDYSYGLTSANETQTSQLEETYQRYLYWWINTPVDVGSNEPVTDCVSHIEGDYIYLMDPYGKKKISATCEIPGGHSIFAPFLHGWCDTGNQGAAYNGSLQNLRDCLGPVNAGRYTLTASVDGKKIIDSTIELMQDTSWKILSDTSAPGALKVIDMLDHFFNVTIKNGSRYTDSYEHPEEFNNSPKTYKAIGICLCGIIDSNLLTPGQEHHLVYHVGYEKSQSEIPLSEVTYTLKIK